MTPNGGTVEEYETWVRVSFLSFWLRFPEELSGFPKMVVRRKADRDRFLRYGLE